jgi:hypothetical protein
MPRPARIAYTFLTAYILTFYSEWMFWTGRPPSETFLLEAIPTLIAYAFITFLFLTAVTYFRVQTLPAVFLAGALYGWLLEGVLVQTMYDSLPLNISLTGLSWHALFSVVFGWWWLPRRLREGHGLLPCLLFGVGLGLWSMGWWLEPDVPIASPESVLLYNFVFGLPLVPVYMWWSGYDLAAFRPTRIEITLAIMIAVAYFAFVTVPTQPLALVVLPPLLALILWALWKNRAHTSAIPSGNATITLQKALPLLLIPLAATIIYIVALSVGLTLPTLQVVYWITLPLGFLALGVSLYQALLRPVRQRES